MNYNYIYSILLFFFVVIMLFKSNINIERYTDKDQNIPAFFRIMRRSDNHALIYLDNQLSFQKTEDKFNTLFTFYNSQILHVVSGKYLHYNDENSHIDLNEFPIASGNWDFNKKGQLILKMGNKKYCVSVNILTGTPEKKCVEYGFYLQNIKYPISDKNILFSKRVEYSADNNEFKWKKKSDANMSFKNIKVKVIGNKDSYDIVKKITSDEIAVNLKLKKEQVVWIFVFGNMNTDVSSKKKTSTKCEKIKRIEPKRRYDIQYHIQYPKLVRSVAGMTAKEFGVFDENSQKVYRCHDILTSPYYVKKYSRFY